MVLQKNQKQLDRIVLYIVIPTQIFVSAIFWFYIIWTQRQLYIIKKEVLSLMDVDAMEKSRYMTRDIIHIIS